MIDNISYGDILQAFCAILVLYLAIFYNKKDKNKENNENEMRLIKKKKSCIIYNS
jgi:hypothetical protein